MASTRQIRSLSHPTASLGLLFCLVGASAACSSDPEEQVLGSGGAGLSSGGSATSGGTGNPGAGGAGTGGVGSSTSGGASSGGAGGAGSGGAGSGGLESSGGAESGGSSSGGAGSGGDANADLEFTCTQVNGFTVTSEWYLAGFENYVDDAAWQLKWQANSYVDEWADPNGDPWSAPIVSPCAQGTASPDRIVFVVLSWNVMPQQQWEDLITGAVNTFDTKYPEIKRFDLLTIVRGPDNQKCGDPNASETVQIPAELDAAIAAVAAQSPERVFVGPKFEAPDCAAFDGAGPHLVEPGVTTIATEIGNHYANEF